MPNKFEYRNYCETETTYPDLSEELRKKECYQLFLAHKAKHRGGWNSNFEELYSQLGEHDAKFRESFQRLLARQQPTLY